MAWGRYCPCATPKTTNTMIVLLEAGHNEETLGKRSPDGKIREYEYNLRIARKVQYILLNCGISCLILDSDTKRNGATDAEELNKRVRLANDIRSMTDKDEMMILVSIHLDASDNVDARGMTCFVAPKSSRHSEQLARCININGKIKKLLGNRAQNADGFLRGNFAIVRDTNMPAVLVECAFMTNKDDAELILKESGVCDIAKCITDGILDFKKIM